MFRSKLWLCLFHALQLSCLIGISSPLAKFKYKKKGIIKKVMVVFEIIIRVTSIYKGFLRLWKLRVCVVHFIDQMPSKFGRWLIWSIYIHGQLYDHQTDLSAEKQKNKEMSMFRHFGYFWACACAFPLDCLLKYRGSKMSPVVANKFAQMHLIDNISNRNGSSS